MKKASIVRLVINIDKETKDSFLQLCKEQDTDANKVIRRYVQRYISKHTENQKGDKK